MEAGQTADASLWCWYPNKWQIGWSFLNLQLNLALNCHTIASYHQIRGKRKGRRNPSPSPYLGICLVYSSRKAWNRKEEKERLQIRKWCGFPIFRGTENKINHKKRLNCNWDISNCFWYHKVDCNRCGSLWIVESSYNLTGVENEVMIP